jgi:hypothetical protein
MDSSRAPNGGLAGWPRPPGPVVDSSLSHRSVTDTESGDGLPGSTVASKRYDMLEPVSPELVLVDPELAARVRASPIEDAPYALHATRVLTGAAELTPRQLVTANGAPGTNARPGHSRAFKRLGGSLLGISLIAIGFAAAYGVSGNDNEPSVVATAKVGPTVPAAGGGSRRASARTLNRQRRASRARTTARAQRVAKPRQRPVAKPRPRPDSRAKRNTPAAPKRRNRAAAGAGAARETSASVERKLLSVIVQSPAGKLPPALINRRSGLAKNNLQAVCTRSSDSRSFLCVVKSALQPAARPVYALYRPTRKGRGSFTWYRSRSR